MKRVKKNGKVLGKHVINLYSTRISRVVKIGDVQILQRDIGNDLIVRDQMTNLGCHLMLNF